MCSRERRATEEANLSMKILSLQTCLENVVSDQMLCVCPTVRHTSSSEHGDEDLSLRPPSIGPSPHTSPGLTPRLTHGSVMGTAQSEEGMSLSTQQALGSTETLKQAGDEQLLSSCESAKTICDSQNVGGDEESSVTGNRTPSISVEDEHDGPAGSPVDTEDHFDWTSEEAPRRPDSLKGIQSFQRSHSNLASLGLAFPAQNGSLTIARWPTVADRAAPPDDWESYTYSPGYDRHSKADSSNDRYSENTRCFYIVGNPSIFHAKREQL